MEWLCGKAELVKEYEREIFYSSISSSNISPEEKKLYFPVYLQILRSKYSGAESSQLAKMETRGSGLSTSTRALWSQYFRKIQSDLIDTKLQIKDFVYDDVQKLKLENAALRDDMQSMQSKIDVLQSQEIPFLKSEMSKLMEINSQMFGLLQKQQQNLSAIPHDSGGELSDNKEISEKTNVSTSTLEEKSHTFGTIASPETDQSANNKVENSLEIQSGAGASSSIFPSIVESDTPRVVVKDVMKLYLGGSNTTKNK
jgi:hypothetical protein